MMLPRPRRSPLSACASLALALTLQTGCGPAEPAAPPPAPVASAPVTTASAEAAPPAAPADTGVEIEGAYCTVHKVTPSTAGAIKAFLASKPGSIVRFANAPPEALAVIKDVPEATWVEWSGSSKDAPLDLAPLASVKSLSHVVLENANVTSLAPLVGLPITYVIFRHVHQLTDFAPLGTFKQMTELTLEKAGVTSVDWLAGLTSLREVWIEAEADVSGFAALSSLTNLTKLRLWNVGTLDLAFVPAMPQLRDLGLSREKVKSLEPLKGATTLEELALVDTDIADIKPLRSLTALSHVALTGNKRLKDLQPLAGLKSLHEVIVIGTGVTSLAPLAKLPDLERVMADRSAVKSIAPLMGLTKLQSVSAPKGIKPAEVEALKKKIPGVSVNLW